MTTAPGRPRTAPLGPDHLQPQDASPAPPDTPRRGAGHRDSRAVILDVAQAELRRGGYHGFSIRDVADAVGLRTATVHHHFPTKAELAVAVVERYCAELDAGLQQIDVFAQDGLQALRLLTALVTDQIRRDTGFCLCGMVAAERDVVPPALMRAAQRFFTLMQTAFAAAVDRGSRDGSLRPGLDVEAEAMTLTVGIEGSMLLARGLGDGRAWSRVLERMVDQLAA